LFRFRARLVAGGKEAAGVSKTPARKVLAGGQVHLPL